jgi:hypothetical protein
MAAHTLCENCLEDGAMGTPFGPNKGDQRESYQDSLYLCPSCRGALLKHDFYTFNSRFTLERTIRNLRTT